MIDFIKAVKRPFSDFKKFGLGFLFGLVPIVNFFVEGYALACAKSAEKKKYDLPEWKEFGTLFIHGVMGFVISFLYFIPALASFAACFGLIINWIGSAYPWSVIEEILAKPAEQMVPAFEALLKGMPLAGIIVFITLGTILLFFAGYVLPSALMLYVKKWKFNDAFNLRDIMKKAFTSNYFVSWLLIAMYSMVFSYAVMYTVGMIPGIGDMASSSLTSFVVGVTQMTLFGELFYSKDKK